LPNSGGQSTLVTQAFHSGSAFSDIDLTIDRQTGNVVEKSARIVTTFADEGPGQRPLAVAGVQALVGNARSAAERITSRFIGIADGSIENTLNRAGESALGNLVAEAQRSALNADLAMTTPAWVRGGLAAGTITYGDLFTIQPFNNRLMRVALTGRKLIEVLNQQWDVETYSRMLQLAGVTYSYSRERPKGDYVVDVKVGGQPLELERTYTAAINAFLAEGGEGFSALAAAPRAPSSILDIEALVQYISQRKTISPVLDGRVTLLQAVASK
jgi:5'-nucleotidase